MNFVLNGYHGESLQPLVSEMKGSKQGTDSFSKNPHNLKKYRIFIGNIRKRKNLNALNPKS